MFNLHKKFNFKIFLFLIIILFSFYRSPYIFFEGRFFAEEAKHFAYAWKNGFLSGLFYVEDLAGYFNLIANILSSIAAIIQLEYAPFVTVYGSFLIILILPYLVFFRESNLFDNNNKKIIGGIILFCSPPFVPEIWLNAINLQVYLGLISIVILFMQNLTKNQKFFNHLIIFISGFSGIYTCSLLPLFAINYFLKKSFYNFLNFLIILFSTIVQLYLIIYFKLKNTLSESVFSNNIDFSSLSLFLYNNIFKAFFGREFIHFIWENSKIFFNHSHIILSILIILFLIVLFYSKNMIKLALKDRTFLYLVYIFFTITFVILIGSLDNYFGGRYAVITGSTLILIIIHLQSIVRKKIFKIFTYLLIIFPLFAGIYEFKPPKQNTKYYYNKLLDCVDCPVWKDELNKWKYDNNYIIKIWPYPIKTMYLN